MAGALLFITISSVSGCHRWVAIKPTEAPKLNGSYQRATGAVPTPGGTVVMVERTVAHVERPDGTLVEIDGDFDARLATARGELRFNHPVNSQLVDQSLVLQGSNRAPTQIPLSDIHRLEVKQGNRGATVAVAIAAGLLGGIAVAVLLTRDSN